MHAHTCACVRARRLPSKDMISKNMVIFGAVGALGLIPAWASGSISLAFALCLYLIYNRGVEQTNSESAQFRKYKVRVIPPKLESILELHRHYPANHDHNCYQS